MEPVMCPPMHHAASAAASPWQQNELLVHGERWQHQTYGS